MDFYIIINPGFTGLNICEILNQEELQEAKEKYEYSKKNATFLYRKLPKEVKTFFKI